MIAGMCAGTILTNFRKATGCVLPCLSLGPIYMSFPEDSCIPVADGGGYVCVAKRAVPVIRRDGAITLPGNGFRRFASQLSVAKSKAAQRASDPCRHSRALHVGGESQPVRERNFFSCVASGPVHVICRCRLLSGPNSRKRMSQIYPPPARGNGIKGRYNR